MAKQKYGRRRQARERERDRPTDATFQIFVRIMLERNSRKSLARLANADVSAVTNMSRAFEYRDLSNVCLAAWDTSKVTTMESMFEGARFTGDIGIAGWNTAAVQTMAAMFYDARGFNQPIGAWDVSSVRTMANMFNSANAFNQPIGDWSVANVQNMSYMFYNASAFNQPIGDWSVANVQNMSYMFYHAIAFNQPIGGWNTASAQTMAYMFRDARAFNQPIGGWNTTAVTGMSGMFYSASAFNQPIGAWNTANVVSMAVMFCNAHAFNQPIDAWNVSKVDEISFMFYNAVAFNQPIPRMSPILMHEFARGATSFQQSIQFWNMTHVRNECFVRCLDDAYAVPFTWLNVPEHLQAAYQRLQTRVLHKASHAMLHVLARIRFAVAASSERAPTRPHAALVALLANSFETPWLLEMCVPAETIRDIVRVCRNC